MNSADIQIGTCFDLTVERPALGGDVIGTAPDGRIVFLRGAAPGDVVSAKVTAVKKKFLRAEVLQVTPGPDRSEPFCSSFGECGGCPWQSIPQETQRHAIDNTISRSILRLAQPDVEVAPTWFDDRSDWRSTTRLRWNGAQVGYFASGSHRLVDIEICPILAPPLPRMLSTVRRELIGVDGQGTVRLTAEHGEDSGTVSIELESVESYQDTSKALRRLVLEPEVHGATLRCLGRPTVSMGEPTNRLGSEQVPHPATAFVQAHQTGSRALVIDVMDHLKGARHVLELYAGSGNFTFALAGRDVRVTAVEVDKAAIGRMKREASSRKLEHLVTPVSAPAHKAPPGEYDSVLLDPPRAGAKEALPMIHRTGANRIVYVSCDPATLARDLRWLVENGWGIAYVRAYDLFPHSGHAEAVAVCRR